MKKLTSTIDLNVIGMKKVNTLIEIIMQHKHEFSPELTAKLTELADSSEFEFDVDYFRGRGIFNPLVCWADGEFIQDVISVNKIIGRIIIAGGKEVFFRNCAIYEQGSIDPLMTLRFLNNGS